MAPSRKKNVFETIIQFIRKDPILVLLLAAPLAILAKGLHWSETLVFTFSALAVIPFASYIGKSTEVLASFTGPRLGGLINATLGNAAELIITITALREGLLELVKASITGSILGNVLLVLGASMLFGGVKNGLQKFDQRNASSNAILLVLAVVALVIPSLLSHSIGDDHSLKVEALTLGVAGVMIILYGLGILFSFKFKPKSTNGIVHTGPMAGTMPVESSSTEPEKSGTIKSTHTEPAIDHPNWSLNIALMVLAISTAGVAYLSELLVGSVEPVVLSLGISEFFLGIILIPIVGNVAEHLVAMKVAIKNQMDLSVEIVMASSLQIALFVAPVLVFISLLFKQPLLLIFNQFELLALIAGISVASMAAMDGESNWLEGAELLAVYLILALAFFLLPV
jgi:Ca2+:H+ antiporter